MTRLDHGRPPRTLIGIHASHEPFDPARLVRVVRAAEAAAVVLPQISRDRSAPASPRED
jgi:hypothetical protein